MRRARPRRCSVPGRSIGARQRSGPMLAPLQTGRVERPAGGDVIVGSLVVYCLMLVFSGLHGGGMGRNGANDKCLPSSFIVETNWKYAGLLKYIAVADLKMDDHDRFAACYFSPVNYLLWELKLKEFSSCKTAASWTRSRNRLFYRFGLRILSIS